MNGPAEIKLDPALFGGSIQASRAKTCATAKGGDRKGRFYRPLRKEFRRDGFDYRQIAREGNAAIYEQRWTGCAEPSVCYGVIRVRHREGFQIGGRFVEPAEVYPNSEAWGTDGFTVGEKELYSRNSASLHDARRNCGRRQPHAEAIPISPLVGFQHAAVETLERFRGWCFLRSRRRTEADEHD